MMWISLSTVVHHFSLLSLYYRRFERYFSFACARDTTFSGESHRQPLTLIITFICAFYQFIPPVQPRTYISVLYDDSTDMRWGLLTDNDLIGTIAEFNSLNYRQFGLALNYLAILGLYINENQIVVVRSKLSLPHESNFT